MFQKYLNAPAAVPTLTPSEAITGAVIERFLSQVDTSGECWEWTGFRNAHGYGHFHIGERTVKAHRVAWAMFHGGTMPAPGFDTDHLCRNRGCVRPSHLEAVTHQENCRRGIAGDLARARHAEITHCPQGHEYTPLNTGIRKNGARRCKACDRDRTRRARAAA